MSRVSRRQLLGGVALVGAAGAVGIDRLARERLPRPTLLVLDSARPASLALAAAHPGVRRVDLAAERTANWRGIRAIGRGGAVAGLTGWNDYVAARQWLEERGLRVRAERHDRAGDLIAWTMA